MSVTEVNPAEAPLTISTPVRAYLSDGSIVVLRTGATVNLGQLEGDGTRHSLELASSEAFRAISLDSVVAMETFETRHEHQTRTALLAGASTVVSLAAGVVLYKAIFGSCPTIYADVDGATLLQAEPFSYSISALFESRDVDRITVRPEARGPGEPAVVRLELRNEALETHYINHMEILEVTHAPGEEVLTDPTGRPLVLENLRPPLAAVDRDGHNVLRAIAERDEVAFRSSAARLASATEADFTDFVELEIAPVPGEREVALVFRVRNTLLNTVLFYDVMLGGGGLRSLDWLGSDLQRIGPAVELARWYQDRMGMRISVERNGAFEQVEYLPDAGPIAWTERAVVIPVDGEMARVRLTFPTDSWFIDRVAVGSLGGHGPVLRIPVARVVDAEGRPDTIAPELLRAPDDAYLVTFPGQRLYLEFDAPAVDEHTTRTFLLATQGYYVEWIRGEWLRAEADRGPFRPSDRAILQAMQRWSEVMEDYERDFHASRIPVR